MRSKAERLLVAVLDPSLLFRLSASGSPVVVEVAVRRLRSEFCEEFAGVSKFAIDD